MKKPNEENRLAHMFDQSHLKRTGRAFSKAYPAFDEKSYVQLYPKLKPLPMKTRVRFLRDEMKSRLPESYPKALALLMKSIKTEKLSGFDLWPTTEFIQTYGLEHSTISLEALKSSRLCLLASGLFVRSSRRIQNDSRFPRSMCAGR